MGDRLGIPGAVDFCFLPVNTCVSLHTYFDHAFDIVSKDALFLLFLKRWAFSLEDLNCAGSLVFFVVRVEACGYICFG